MNPERMVPEKKEQLKVYKTAEAEVSRDDILERAALILSDNPKYPDDRGEQANILWARKAIREALKEKGVTYFHNLEKQISEDAPEVLGLI